MTISRVNTAEITPPFEKKQVMGIGSGKRDRMYTKHLLTDANGRPELIMLLRIVCQEHLWT